MINVIIFLDIFRHTRGFAMTENNQAKSTTLTDEDIVAVRKSSRRKLLASMGVAVVGTATLLSGARKARASDPKQFETDKTPPKIDPDND
jgi:hypothetical protein